VIASQQGSSREVLPRCRSSAKSRRPEGQRPLLDTISNNSRAENAEKARRSLAKVAIRRVEKTPRLWYTWGANPIKYKSN
jgi:hypothetical protein